MQILGLRDNDLLELPREVGELSRLRELHIQNNRLTVLPPDLANLDLQSSKSILKMEENPWVQPIAEQYLIGINHVLDYIKSEAYRSKFVICYILFVTLNLLLIQKILYSSLQSSFWCHSIWKLTAKGRQI